MKFNKQLAIECAILCEFAYDGTYPKDKYECFGMFSGDLGHVLRKKGTNEISICLRGTRDLKDFISDAKFTKVNTSYGDIHEGFYDDFRKVMPELAHILETLPGGVQYNFAITGHSLGAAIAVLIAYALTNDLLYETWNIFGNVVVYPIAMPKVGNIVFSRKYRDSCIPTYNIANKYDIVPRMPIGFNYSRLTSQFNVHFQNFEVAQNHSIKNYKLALIKLQDF